MPTVTELGQRLKAKHPGVYDDLPDDEVGRRAKAKYPGSYDDFADTTHVAELAMTPESNPATQFLESLRGRSLEMLPTAGGFIGGLVGKLGGYPGAVAGAGLGGGAGEGARELLSGEPLSGEKMAREAGGQAAWEAAGGALAKGASMAARPIMRGTLSVLPKGFDNTVETMLKEKIPVTMAGMKKTARLRGSSASALRDILNRAEASGKTFKSEDVAAEVTELLKSKTVRPSLKPLMARELDQFIKQQGGKITPTALKEIKREYQGGARGAYSAIAERGSDIGSAASQRYAHALASGAEKELATIPGVAAQEARTQSLIGASRAVSGALRSPPKVIPKAIAATIGGGLGFGVSHTPVGASAGALAAEVLTSKAAQSHLAILLNSKWFSRFSRQFPRGAAELMKQAAYADRPYSDRPDASEVVP